MNTKAMDAANKYDNTATMTSQGTTFSTDSYTTMEATTTTRN
jgi:hypothetical protein